MKIVKKTGYLCCVSLGALSGFLLAGVFGLSIGGLFGVLFGFILDKSFSLL